MLRKYNFTESPIVEIVNDILYDSSLRKASDIHFDPFENFVKIRIRIDGTLIDYATVPNEYKQNLITRIKILSGMNITETRLPQDGAIKIKIEDSDLDMRVSSLPTNLGEKVVIRIMDYKASLSGIEHLDFNEENLNKVLEMINKPNGIILVTGATGTGKSTTVYSILQRINREEVNLITVEDPIEMDITGINQVQVNSEIGLTFANTLRSILRQDPDIIMIGEIRDSETAKIAVRASITGHLVLSTIHTNNSLTTIERLLDMDVERYLLSSALSGIISQRLARRLCPECSTKRPAKDYEKKLYKDYLNMDINEIHAPVGCDKCHNGYSGRIAIQEVLLINEEIRDAINDNIAKEDLRNLVYNKGNVITMFQDGLLKVLNGSTSIEEVMRLIEVDDNDKISEYDHQKDIPIDEVQEEVVEDDNDEQIITSDFTDFTTEITQTDEDDNKIPNINIETLDF